MDAAQPAEFGAHHVELGAGGLGLCQRSESTLGGVAPGAAEGPMFGRTFGSIWRPLAMMHLTKRTVTVLLIRETTLLRR